MLKLIIQDKTYLWQEKPDRFIRDEDGVYESFSKGKMLNLYRDCGVVVIEDGKEIDKGVLSDLFND
jgi:hypothetical protein